VLLTVRQLTYAYARVQALHGVDLDVDEGEVVAIIGANGAGKTTTLRCVSGLNTAASGSIRFRDRDITHLPPERIVALGVAHVPEGRRIFPELSVEDNLRLGAYAVRDGQGVRRRMQAIFDRFPRLRERRSQPAGTLSGGEQQMVALGRALMGDPRLLMLDEPSLGLAPRLVEEVFRIIAEIRDAGTTVLLVEQNAHMALAVADRAYVFQNGRVAAHGPAQELAADDAIRRAYLGE
jgi:branched-chain amino acid transport system ATP-binding protein